MGLAKKLQSNQSSFCDSEKVASIGWQPIEVILTREDLQDYPGFAELRLQLPKFRITKKVDIFSLGCLIFYVLTKQHCFGSHFEREVNIAKDNPNLNMLVGLPQAHHLVSGMLSQNPEDRPPISEILGHPFWWDEAKWILFVKEASDRLDAEKPSSEFVKKFECDSFSIVGNDWSTMVSSELMENLGKRRKYNFSSVRDLLRLIRLIFFLRSSHKNLFILKFTFLENASILISFPPKEIRVNTGTTCLKMFKKFLARFLVHF